MSTGETFLLYSMLSCCAIGIALALKVLWCTWRRHTREREREHAARHVRRVA